MILRTTLISTVFALIAVLSFNRSLHAQSRPIPNEKHTAYLADFRAAYVKSMTEKKSELLAPYFADTVRLMAPFQKTILGKANALLYHKTFHTRFDIRSYQRAMVEAVDMGRMIAESGTFAITMHATSSSKTYDVKGKYLVLWKKLPDGTLRFATEAWNFDHAIDFAPQINFKEIPVTDVAFMAHVNINNNINFELAALNRLLEATVSQHDAGIWSLFYANDALLLHGGAPASKGRKAIDEFLIHHCGEIPIFEKLDIRNDRVDHLGNFVIEYASHIATVRNGNWSGVGLGKDLRVWRREPDGSLKMIFQIGSYD